MKHSITTGFSFGSTSGIITTIGLMIGLYAGTGSRLAILGGIITIAISDAMSDAMGIHMSEEAENVHTPAQIWASTISTFFFKFVFAISFILPVLCFGLRTAVIISVAWSLLLLTTLSYFLAKKQETSAYKAISEHLMIAIIVITITYFVGEWVKMRFGVTQVI